MVVILLYKLSSTDSLIDPRWFHCEISHSSSSPGVTVPQALVSTRISQLGMPLRITTAWGRQFKSQLFSEFSKIVGVKHLHTTNYPSFNGVTECFHWQLKAALRTYPHHHQWSEHLPLVLSRCQSIVKEDLGFAPIQLLYGSSLLLLGQMLTPVDALGQGPSLYITLLRSYFRDLPLPDIRPHLSSHQISLPGLRFLAGTIMFKVLSPPPYKRPYTAFDRINKCLILDINGSKETISMNCVKKCF